MKNQIHWTGINLKNFANKYLLRDSKREVTFQLTSFGTVK